MFISFIIPNSFFICEINGNIVCLFLCGPPYLTEPQYNPMINFIWLSCALISLAGLISISYKIFNFKNDNKALN